MATVITQGKKWTQEIVCKSCEARLLVDETDVKYEGGFFLKLSLGLLLDWDDSDFYVRCPTCRHQNYLMTLPAHVEKLARVGTPPGRSENV
jgi:DNA-directed RNA polymerase subunit RPC12/RpoP